MTTEDLNKLNDALKLIRMQNIIYARSVAIHSPWDAQIEAIELCLGFKPDIITKEDWNVLDASFDKHYDLLFFSNVLMYVNDPFVALHNIFKSCRYLLLQDLIIRDRGDQIFGTDGDCMRFSHGDFVSNYGFAFDLKKELYPTVFFIPYIDDGQYLHFITLIKGDLP